MNDIRNHPITMMRAEQPESLDATTRKVALKCKHAFLPGKPERCCHCGISKDDWETLQAAQYSPAVWGGLGGFGALQPPNYYDFDAWLRAHGYKQRKVALDYMVYGNGAFEDARPDTCEPAGLTEAKLQKTLDQIRSQCVSKDISKYLTPAYTWHLPDFTTAAHCTSKIQKKWDEPSSAPASDGDKVGDQPK